MDINLNLIGKTSIIELFLKAFCNIVKSYINKISDYIIIINAVCLPHKCSGDFFLLRCGSKLVP